MGQKTNAIALRIGKTKEWELKHIEKKSTESSYYIFKEVEIQNFANKFFNNYGLKIQRCKIYINERIMHIFISYSMSEKSFGLITELNAKENLKFLVNPSLNSILQRKILKKKDAYNYWSQWHKFKRVGSLKYSFKAVALRLKLKNSYRFRRDKILEFYKKTKQSYYSNKLVIQFLKSLTEYLNISGYFTVSLTCKHINKNLITQLNKKNSKIIKRVIPQLRRYQNSSYFKDGLNILFQSMVNKQSQKLIAEYIALELSKLKKHSFFFRFIQTALTLLYKQEFSRIYGIKIQIKGRINGTPRSKKKTISIGKSIKNLSIFYNINYHESTAFTKNGSLGVKVWLSEKTN
jgi:ribosomal protein S3